MNHLQRGLVVDINLDPTQGSETGKIRPCVIVTNDTYNQKIPIIQVVPISAWNEKKSLIITNVDILPDDTNERTKKSIADCLQTRPIDRRYRLVKIRGKLTKDVMLRIDEALRIVFSLR